MPAQTSIGFWVLEGVGILLCVLLLAGQTVALIDYDLTVSLGLQEPASEITEIGVIFNKAFGAADTFLYLPLLVIGLVGFWFRRMWGTIALAAALGITAYWPIFSLYALYAAIGTPGFTFSRHTSYTFMLVPISVYALWGLVFLYRTRDRLR
ncbi:MAG TPA: hypothetical protein VIH40_06835 [Xanthobacteraceae bacterium]